MQDFLISHHKLHKGETLFVGFFDILGKVVANEVCEGEKREGTGNYCLRFISLRDMIHKASSLLSLNTPILSESYLSLQLTTSNSRAPVHDRY